MFLRLVKNSFKCLYERVLMGGKVYRIKHEYQIHGYSIYVDMLYHRYTDSYRDDTIKLQKKSDFIKYINELLDLRDAKWNLKQYLKILHSPKKKEDYKAIEGFIETVVFGKLFSSTCYINKLIIKDISEIRNEKIKLLIK